MGSYLSDMNGGLQRGGYGMHSLGRPQVPGDSRIIPDEDPGEIVVQSFTQPRGDSRATTVGRPASGLLRRGMGSRGMGNGASIRDGGMRGRYGYGYYSGESGGYDSMKEYGGLLSGGLGQSAGEPVYGSNGIIFNPSVALDQVPQARLDYSGATIVASTGFPDAAQKIKAAIPNTSIVTVPPVWETNADSRRSFPDFLDTLRNEFPRIDSLFDGSVKKVILVGGIWWNPVGLALHDTQMRFQEGRHTWYDWDSAGDPLYPLKSFSSDALWFENGAGIVSVVPNYKEYRNQVATSAAPPVPFETVSMVMGNGWRFADDLSYTEDTDLLKQNTRAAADLFVSKMKQYTSGSTGVKTAGFGGATTWIVAGGAALALAQMGVFGKQFKLF